MAMQSNIRTNLPFKPSNVSSQSLPLKPYKTPTILSLKPKAQLHFSISTSKTPQNTKRFQLSASAAEPILAQDQEIPRKRKKLGVLVKPMEKPRIVLKLIWMEKAIGIGLNQVIPGHGTIPLSPYYFWPKEDAWELLKVFLERKPWISRSQMTILLNQATDIINLWQETGAKL